VPTGIVVCGSMSSSCTTPSLQLSTSMAAQHQQPFMPRPGTWRTFEITTQVEVLKPAGVTRAWLPIPVVNSEYQKTAGNQWWGNAKTMQVITDPKVGAVRV